MTYAWCNTSTARNLWNEPGDPRGIDSVQTLTQDKVQYWQPVATGHALQLLMTCKMCAEGTSGFTILNMWTCFSWSNFISEKPVQSIYVDYWMNFQKVKFGCSKKIVWEISKKLFPRCIWPCRVVVQSDIKEYGFIFRAVWIGNSNFRWTTWLVSGNNLFCVSPM